MSRRLRTYAYAGLMAVLPAAGWADDRWESGSWGSNDDTLTTCNELVHGAVQQGHDLEGEIDLDWMMFRGRARHSYEARVSSGSTAWDYGGCLVCPRFDRMDPLTSATVLTPGVPDGASIYFVGTMAVRWIATASADEYLRVTGQTPHVAADTYDVELWDTTYFMPRFNNSSSQVTILVIQNTKDSLVTGEIYFYNSAGTLLSTQPLSIPAQGVQVLNSATIPALAGQSGSVTIAQLGGYGALAGKGVSLETTTGFTFDTALSPLPR